MALPYPLNAWVDKLNTLLDFFIDPCDAPITVYAQTLLPALLEAAITYWAIDPGEVLINWARPSKEISRYRNRKKGRRGPKGAKKARWGKLGKVLNFDPNEKIGKKLQGLRGPLLPITNGSTVFLWRLLGFVQVIGFWWMCWEIFLGFWVRWSSLLHETEFCQASQDWIFLGRNDPVLVGSGVLYNPVLAQNIEKQRGQVAYTLGNGDIGPRVGTVMVNVTATEPPASGLLYEVSIWAGPAGAGSPLARVAGITQEGVPLSVKASATLPPNTSFTIAIKTDALFMLSRTDAVYIQAKG